MTSTVLFQPFSSVIITLLAFFVMVWPGYALLHLSGHGRHKWPAALYAGPAITLALWIITLSGAAWASIPLSRLFGPVWIATLLLAIAGIALRLSVSRRIVAEKRSDLLWLWGVAGGFPLLIMPATARFGLGDFVNSTYADPWSYIMVADYLSAVARGAEGGLSALHQYASHLMNTRNASSAILAHLAFGFGDVKTDQMMTPLCLLLLFANTSALLCFARGAFARADAALAFTVLAGLGWPANIVFAGNFDQLLLLPLLPVIAALALRAGNGVNLIRGSMMIGLLSAAALLAYVELAFIGLVIAMAFVAAAPGRPFAVTMTRAVLIACIAVPVFTLLTWPGLDALITMLKTQYLSTTAGTTRPGDGYFLGLLSLRRLPDSLWALGAEYAQTHIIVLPWLLGAVLGVITLVGVWTERWRWGPLLALAIVAAGFLHFVIREHYAYAAYKIISINFWLIAFFTVAGGLAFAQWLTYRIGARLPVAATATAILLLTVIDRTSVQSRVVHYKQNALHQRAYREVETVNKLVGKAPTLIAVRDDLANEWATFYLAGMPVLIAPYRIYMAQSHVIPFMERAEKVDPAAIRFIVTDRNEAVRASLSGARQVWDGEAYSLWEVTDSNWTVLADIINPNGIEPGGTWLGGDATKFLIVAGKAGPATLAANLAPGPRAASGKRVFDVALQDVGGDHRIEVTPGAVGLSIDLAAGKTVVSIKVNEPVSGEISANGDLRPMILRLMDYRVERSDKS